MDSQPGQSVWTTSINIYEIRYDLQSMPTGKKQSTLMALFEHWLTVVIQQRIVSFDAAAARRAADLAAERRATGQPGDARDTMISGIVLTSHAMLTTHNAKHFEDIAKSVVNPWEA
jgi:hypothetical protein